MIRAESLHTDAFPSSEAFDLINTSLQSDDAERKDAIKKGNAIFAFTLQNKSGQVESWYIDLKEKGEVGRGTGPEGQKTSGMLASLTGLCSASALSRAHVEEQGWGSEGRLIAGY